MLERTSDGHVPLLAGEDVGLKAPTEVGTRSAKDEGVELSRVIDVLNDRFGTDFGPENELFVEQVIAKASAREDVQQQARANALGNFRLAIEQVLMDAVIDSLGQNQEMATRFINEEELREAMGREMARRVWEGVRGE